MLRSSSPARIALASALVYALSRISIAQAQPAPAEPAPAPAAPAAPPAAAEAPASPPPADNTSELKKQLEQQRADLDEQDERISELQKELKAMKAAAAPAEPVKSATQPGPLPAAASPASDDAPLKFTGYAQTQYERHQDSEDQLLPGGKPINQNRFLIRRLRLKLARDWRYGGAMVELDANTVNGPSIGVQHVEISFAYRNADGTPMVSLTGGLFDVPFGRELTESPRERPFMERSLASRAFFPAEPDLGVRLSGQIAWLRYAMAFINGQPLGERTGFVLQDPNNHKDVVGRLGVSVDVPDSVRISGGVSVLNGLGFHPGADPTKATLVWQDRDGNGQVNPGEIIGVGGSAGLPAQNFKRWLVGSDIGFELTSAIGITRLFGELSVGSNMDRGLYVADPITFGRDQRELGYFVSVVQEVGQGKLGGYDLGGVVLGPIVGLRYDVYNPNSDFLGAANGKIVPRTETVRTWAPLIGLQVPHHARLIAEYDFVQDNLALSSAGVPTDKKNNVLTVRFQGEF